jgi:IS1 family transposase
MIVDANIAISVDTFHPFQGQPASWIAPMNILSSAQQISVISALTEGCSIRATERLTDIHRDTIMRLGVRVGDGCAGLHDRMMRDLHVNLLEFDEVWSFVGKKQKRLRPDDLREKGDCYIFTALSTTHKAIVSYKIGKRSGANANAFARDVRQRILGRPQISSDGFSPYVDAIEQAFGSEVDYGQIVKVYAGEPGPDTARRYSPGVVVDVRKAAIAGAPDRMKISTSFVERSNLTVRMQCRRLTRLTNAFSKKLENHAAAVALFVAHYNLCRVHETLRVTPAMALGVTDHIWTIGELIDAATTGQRPAPGVRKFAVIQGGRA